MGGWPGPRTDPQGAVLQQGGDRGGPAAFPRREEFPVCSLVPLDDPGGNVPAALADLAEDVVVQAAGCEVGCVAAAVAVEEREHGLVGWDVGGMSDQLMGSRV